MPGNPGKNFYAFVRRVTKKALSHPTKKTYFTEEFVLKES